MTIYNLGSINADIFYRVPHLPMAGETISAMSIDRGLGGKGANMSVAAARAAGRIVHIGSVGDDGVWAKDRLTEFGVDTRHIHVGGTTGHAIINVDDAGENAIVLLGGANQEITTDMVGAALSGANVGDVLLMQNETNAQVEAAQMAHKLGLKVAYAAAPFHIDAVKGVLPYLDYLFVNEVEAAQLTEAMGQDVSHLGIDNVIVTLGSDGCVWYGSNMTEGQKFAARPVEAVDTTGAGDTFTGYVLAALDRGLSMEQAIELATKAAALMVTRHGTSDVIPDLKDIQDHFD